MNARGGADGAGAGSGAVSGGDKDEQIQMLLQQNGKLRQKLKEFSSALDRALKGDSSAYKAIGNLRIASSAALQSKELINAQKQIEIHKRAIEVRLRACVFFYGVSCLLLSLAPALDSN